LHPYRRLLKGLLLMALLVAAGWLLQSGAFGVLPDKAWVDGEIRNQGMAGQLGFIGIAALFASLGLPRQVVAFLGGYAFGFVSGTLLAMLAVLVACVMSFGYGRVARHFLGVSGVPERFRRVASFVHDHTFTTTLVIRLLPAGSNLLLNLAAGLGGIRALPFFAGSALGYVPQMLIFALVGSGIRVDPALRIGVGVALFVISGVLGVQLYRRYRDRLPVAPGEQA
jgi:uncharacterized membrane protein YdjX (TVP38/TMEM64 family)